MSPAEYGSRPGTAGETALYAHPPSSARSPRRARRPGTRGRTTGGEQKESMEQKEKRLQAKFFAAIRTSNIKPFKALLSHSLVGANVCNFSNNSALHEAIRVGNRSFAMKLIQLGAEKDGKNDLGETPMHIAARKGYVHCVVMLISKGANMNMVDNELRTPLHLAALYNQASTVKALLERESIVVFRDIKRYTALHYAAEHGYKECVWYLLQVTPPTPVFTNAMPTPFRLAEDNGHDVCASLIKKWIQDWRKERQKQGLSLPGIRRKSAAAQNGGKSPRAASRSSRPRTSGPRVRRETIAHTRDARSDYNRKSGWLKPLFSKEQQKGSQQQPGQEASNTGGEEGDDGQEREQEAREGEEVDGQSSAAAPAQNDGEAYENPPAGADDDKLYDNPNLEQNDTAGDSGA
eukprot:TRINITY_DN8360_c0_g1_i1.p1 TRINITY_DN8360_c0_g1~~TRINITY_DN8360_c0_g1_i1.p1  ORF type:complete len:406 (+),score=65.70 TRINITY_DN8360_c0_g1_i1:266-1483(+)